MTTKQREFALSDGRRLILKPVTSDDEEFLVSVYASTRAEELAQVDWPEENKNAFIKWQFDMQRQEYLKRFPDAEYYLIVIDNQPAGRIWIGEDDEQVRLLDIAILPEFQNRGAGTALLRWL